NNVHKFKLQVIGSMVLIITMIILIIASLNFWSFHNESIRLNKEILHEKNSTINGKMTEKLEIYKHILSSIKIDDDSYRNGSLSSNLTNQLQSIHNIFGNISIGVFLFDREGSLYDMSGKITEVNVKKFNVIILSKHSRKVKSSMFQSLILHQLRERSYSV
ncbi:hypothetical protein AB4622_25680, partial [Vibrio splendidus]